MKVEKEDVIPGMYEVGSLAAHLQIEFDRGCPMVVQNETMLGPTICGVPKCNQNLLVAAIEDQL
jgi:hypothetical protein